MRLSYFFLGILAIAAVAGAGETAPSPPSNPPAKPKKPVVPKREFVARMSDADMVAFSKRFETELWPIMTRSKGDCTHCHDGDSKSQL